MSQKSEILRYLKSGNTITPDEARRWFGCDRLGARIWTLRHKDGYPDIESPLIDVGNGKHVAQYSLPQKGQLELNL